MGTPELWTGMDKNTQLITGPAALSPHFNSFEKKDKRSSSVFLGPASVKLKIYPIIKNPCLESFDVYSGARAQEL